jgi:hypothetical protein
MKTSLTPLGVRDAEFIDLVIEVIADLAREERQWLPDMATTVLEVAAEYGFLRADAAATYITKVKGAEA